jgi:hypothetical protein
MRPLPTPPLFALLAVAIAGCAPAATADPDDDAARGGGPTPVDEHAGGADERGGAGGGAGGGAAEGAGDDHDAVDDTDADADGDGLGDRYEAELARRYLPFLSNHPDDRCPRSGLVFRARPHPDDARLVHVVYSRLYEKDCGLTPHVGDNEAFGVTIDPAAPPPSGIVAIVAVSHQDTLCQRTTSCGTCPGLEACDTASHHGEDWPVLYASRNKHAGAVNLRRGCSFFSSCFDSCALAAEPALVPLVNAGEPEAPLVNDLTAQGFITALQGWTEAAVFRYDPWSDAEFGTAGVVRDDLLDDAFLPPACLAAAR